MSQLLHYFENQWKQAKSAAQAIMDRADEEGRDLTLEERAEVEVRMDEYKAYNAKAAAELDKIKLREKLEGPPEGNGEIRGGGLQREAGIPRTLGDAIVSTGVFKAMQTRYRENGGQLGSAFRTEPVTVPWTFRSKAAESPVLESDNTSLFGDGSDAGALTTLRPLETPGFNQIRLTIADLLPNIPVSVGNSVTYPIVADRTPFGSVSFPTAEGDSKSLVKYEFDVATAILQKITAMTKISSEWLEDAPAIAAYINADLPYQIRYNEELYLSSALYDNTSDATPLTNATTTFDAILAAMTEIQVAGFEPDGMLITPADWAELLATKFDGGDEHYVGGGPFMSTNNPWGLRVVVSQAAEAGHPLVGAFGRGATVYRRGGLTVESTNSNDTDFEINLITIRAEERLVLGVTYQEAFVSADITGA